MACFVSKAIRRKGNRQGDLLDDSLPTKRGRKDKGQKPRKGCSSSRSRPSVEKSEHGKRNKSEDGDRGKGHGKGRHSDSSMKMNPGRMKNENALVLSKPSVPATNVIRKKVDPETAKYFLEISNLFDNKEIDLEERSTICANALEETKGKELELVTDGVISHTLQILVEGCELEQLCMFLRNCIESFPVIAMDKFGSHVAEAVLKSLVTHLEDETSRVIVEDILNKIRKVIAADATNVMCSCYGSHVLWMLLCLSKGVPLDSLQDFHTTKRSTVLAERLSCGLNRSGGQNPTNFEHGFSDMFKSFVRQMLQNVKDDISTLLTEKNSSLVLQTAVKLSAGDDHKLLHIISILLGYDEDDTAQKKDYSEQKNKIVALLEDAAYSHLLEVIVEVAPEELHSNMLISTLKGALLAISSHHCGNYVVQALISSAKTADQCSETVQVLLASALTGLQGHYGEIAVNPSGSFLVEKCFTASNFSHKEAIVSELLAMQNELSKTRHAIYLLKKLDVYRYSRRPDQWRAAQTLKETTQREFQMEFGLNSNPIGQSIEELLSPLSPTKKHKQKEKIDKISEDASSNKQDLSQKSTKRQRSAKATFEGESSSKKLVSDTTSMSFLNNSGKRKSPGFLSDKPSLKKQKHQRPNSGQSDSRRFVRDSASTPFVRNDGKQKQSIAELAALASKEKLTAGEVRKLLKPEISAKS